MLTRLLFILLVFISVPAFATHNRAGEITYEHLAGLEYKVTLTTYTKTSAIAADRPALELKWGDGSSDTLSRDQIIYLTGDAQKNLYYGTHTYAGPGTFVISMEDPNRNEGVVNIPSSVSTVFYIESVLTIDPVLGHNNSVILTNGPLDNACIDKLYIHNTGAYDPDGDSLSYSLIVCKALDGLPIPGYTYPDQWPVGPDNQMYIDQISGNVFWDTPQLQGEYNIAILIEEWRQGVLMGTVLRDMQVTVFFCDNNPPVIDPIPDTCILADNILILNISADDPDGNSIDLDAFGEPFEITGNEATFTQANVGPPANGTFIWTPDCERVRLNPYTVNIKAKDNSFEIDLVDFKSFQVTVIAPGPENLIALPLGNTVILGWSESECSHASGYKIYRRADSLGYEPDHCVTGVPISTGYVFIGETEGFDNTNYIDNNGLALGQKYCYMVTAIFPDGAESLPSLESCAILIKDLPVITNVSVGETDTETGRDTIIWSNPTELNETQYSGPYHYKVFRGEGYNEPSILVYTSPVSNEIINYQDTSFVDTGLDTKTQVNTYRIDLYSDDNFVGSTFSTPSIYLSTEPGDNKLILHINDQTPWIHYSYHIYRYDDDLADFIYIDSTIIPLFIDTGLVNLETYCYYVLAKGGYASTSILPELINYSQETCGIPWDNEAPCPPELSIDSDCEAGDNFLMWTNPNNYCADDVMLYTIYYKPYENQGEFEPILTINNALDTSYLFSDLFSVAGCYAVTASDSLNSDPDGNIARNESEFSNIVCVENCPDYGMPNVFTPNNDGVNDLLKPLINRQVESIEFVIYNRWGKIIFQTENADINWDGKDINSNEDVSEGVYFYTIRLNVIKLNGNTTTATAGYVYIFRSEQNTN
jgi:gliding motility-associated-like protein